MDPAFTPTLAFEEVWTGSRGPGTQRLLDLSIPVLQSVPTPAVKARRESGKSPPARGVPTKLVEAKEGTRNNKHSTRRTAWRSFPIRSIPAPPRVRRVRAASLTAVILALSWTFVRSDADCAGKQPRAFSYFSSQWAGTAAHPSLSPCSRVCWRPRSRFLCFACSWVWACCCWLSLPCFCSRFFTNTMRLTADAP